MQAVLTDLPVLLLLLLFQPQGPESEFHSLDVGRPLPAIFLDGPFGAPTQAWNDYEVVTLIGAGIGITPMSSVLR